MRRTDGRIGKAYGVLLSDSKELTILDLCVDLLSLDSDLHPVQLENKFVEQQCNRLGICKR